MTLEASRREFSHTTNKPKTRFAYTVTDSRFSYLKTPTMSLATHSLLSWLLRKECFPWVAQDNILAWVCRVKLHLPIYSY